MKSLSLVILTLAASTTGASDLPPTKEKLSLTEERLLRRIVYRSGPSISTVLDENKAPTRMLHVPRELEAIYAKKPQATLRLLLKIVEWGAPKDALISSGYIGGLVRGPAYGAIAATFSTDILDDIIEGSDESYRERIRDGCIRLINDKSKRDRERAERK
jgi:hypothetical protein